MSAEKMKRIIYDAISKQIHDATEKSVSGSARYTAADALLDRRYDGYDIAVAQALAEAVGINLETVI